MKIYTAKEDADQVAYIYLWVLDVSWRATKVAIWLGATKCGLAIGLGYVDLVRVEGDHIISNETRRYYGPILIKFKKEKKQ
jgi:hypothetical protein